VIDNRDLIDISIITQPKLSTAFSLSSARNKGATLARGTWLFFTDAGCMLDPNFIVHFDKIKHNHKKKYIYTGERIFVHIKKDMEKVKFDQVYFKSLKRVSSASNYHKIIDKRFPWLENIGNEKHPWNFFHGCFMLVPRELYMKVNGSDLRFDGHWGYEDIDLIHTIITRAGGIPQYNRNMKIYHQEFDEDINKLSNSENGHRMNKKNNPNFLLICNKIEGFKEFKVQHFQDLGLDVDI